MESLTVELAPDVAARLRQAAAANDYPSSAAFVEGLIEDWEMTSDMTRLAWLRNAIREGEESGPDISLEELDAHLIRTIEDAARSST